MVALIIIGVLALIITAILLIPVGVDLGYEGGEFHLAAKINGFLLQLFPKPARDESKKPKEKKEKKEKKQKKKKEPKPEKEGKEKPKRKLNFSRDEILGLVKAALKGVGRFGRKLKVNRFHLNYVAAGDDPYNTAMSFAYVNAALSSLAPICARRFTVKDCEVRTDIDFLAEAMTLDLGLALTIRIGQILGVGFSVGFGALKILIRNKLRLRKERKRLKKEGGDADETPEKEKKNIQAEERMEANG